MFDVDKFMKKVGDIGSSIKKETSRYAPAMLSQDKRLANAFSTVVSTLVLSDLEVENEETIQAINFIQNDPILKEKGLVIYSIDFYSNIINELSQLFNNEPAFLVQKAKVIQENIPGLSDEYKSYIRALCNQLTVGANPREMLVRDEIIVALD